MIKGVIGLGLTILLFKLLIPTLADGVEKTILSLLEAVRHIALLISKSSPALVLPAVPFR